MASNTAEVTSKGSFSSTVNPASGKPDGAVRSTEKKEKRSHSEVADTSTGDEFASIQKQLDQLSSEVKQAREDFKTLMTKDEMKTFIKNTNQKMVTTVQNKVEESLGKRMDEKLDEKTDAKLKDKLEKNLDEKVKEKLDEANTTMDLLTYETVQLKEEADKLKKELNKSKNLAEIAIQKANTNEKYSRKNNVKIMGVVEDEDENDRRKLNKKSSKYPGKKGWVETGGQQNNGTAVQFLSCFSPFQFFPYIIHCFSVSKHQKWGLVFSLFPELVSILFRNVSKQLKHLDLVDFLPVSVRFSFFPI